MKDGEGAKSAIALIEKLLSLQLVLHHKHPRNAFGKLMTTRVAAGYVLGFHDACFQIMGLVDPNDRAAGLPLLETSYKHIFGNQAGFTLWDASLRLQTDRAFQIGRASGWEDFVDFHSKKTPTLGLMNIIGLGFNAEMVERALHNRDTVTAAPSSQVRDTTCGAEVRIGKSFVQSQLDFEKAGRRRLVLAGVLVTMVLVVTWLVRL